MSENILDIQQNSNRSTTSTTEQTRLLNTSTTSYTATQHGSNSTQTVISIEGQESSRRYDIHSSTLGGSFKIAALNKYQEVITAGQPLIPVNQLTEKIQDILIFNEAKQRQERQSLQASRKQKKIQINQNDTAAIVPTNDTDSTTSSSSSSDEDGSSKKALLKKKISDWSLDGSSSNNDSKLRKRDFAAGALRFATDRWKEKHGYSKSQESSSSSLFDAIPNTTSVKTTTTILNSAQDQTTKIQQTKTKQLPISSAESIFNVAKNASVCAVLALLHEHKQSSNHSTETDISLQSLALSTLNLGLKSHDTSTSHIVLYEMLTTKWSNGKSALDWAVENNSQLILNDARVQNVIEDLWKSGPSWRQDPKHPSNIWISKSSIPLDSKKIKEFSPKKFGIFVLVRTITDFLAKCASVRFQAIIALFSFFIYLVLHLSSVSNEDYTSDTLFAIEYVYYVFVVSDLLLEFYKFWTQPLRSIKKISFYVTWLTIFLLVSSFVIRVFTLIVVYNIDYEVYLLTLSYSLLILATPLMFYRLFVASSDLCWSTAKVSYILRQCFVNSLWVFNLGFFILLGFWVALSCLQSNDIRPLSMLRLLVFGALHAPEISNTLYYQPTVAGILLALYLFSTVIILGALLIASFLSTLLEINTKLETVKREWIIERCLKSNPTLNTFIPSVAINLIFGIIRWICRVVFKRQSPVVYVEKAYQVLWYIIYSPIIIVAGFFELVSTLLFRWKSVVNIFKRTNEIVS